MQLHSSEEVKANVVELCDEDDYGSRELWWHTSAGAQAKQIPALRGIFLHVVREFVSAGKLIAKCQQTGGKVTTTEYDREKLAREIDSADNPGLDSYF
ncbi:MAG TPA: hypothetical protein VFQ78_09905 [Candidatus Udaeobacter sp.]|jgi:hypothetical protein|nr:hypothetical protein [Candidatus Udaeobacter sp.]